MAQLETQPDHVEVDAVLASAIKRVPISGSGVDALEKRKETNNNWPVKTEELRGSFEKVKNGLIAGLKALGSTVPRT